MKGRGGGGGQNERFLLPQANARVGPCLYVRADGYSRPADMPPSSVRRLPAGYQILDKIPGASPAHPFRKHPGSRPPALKGISDAPHVTILSDARAYAPIFSSRQGRIRGWRDSRYACEDRCHDKKGWRPGQSAIHRGGYKGFTVSLGSGFTVALPDIKQSPCQTFGWEGEVVPAPPGGSLDGCH